MRTSKINTRTRLLLTGMGLILALGSLRAQTTTAFEYLNQTNINALISADGQLFWDGKQSNFEAPKGSGKNTISSAALWMGGYDDQGIIHLAAQTYRESGTDFWSGPLDTSTGKTDSATSALFNKVWKVTKLEIDSFRGGLSKPVSVMNWPGNGNTSKGQANRMAPFVDLNGNGIYEPLNGEYPDIQGDVMAWWVYNDATPTHTYSKAAPLYVEIQGSAFTYNCPDDPILSNTIFIKYKVTNRSKSTYKNCFMGQFADLDIGNIFDDYIGSDSTTNTFYGYNSTDLDKDTIVTGKGFSYSYKGYGKTLPAQSVSFLKGITGDNGKEMGMSKFMYYNNETDVPQGNPKLAMDFYNLLSGHWMNGKQLTNGGTGYGGTAGANYAFPGIPGDHKSWNELAPHNAAGDRRGLGSFGPFTFAPGSSKEFIVAFGFHQAAGGKTLQSLQLMRDEVRQLNEKYKRGSLTACTGLSNCITADSCVWPGDASNDGQGYMDDLFRIGYAFGATGPARTLASADWGAQASKGWSRTFPDGENFKYADCNGDGKIDSLDVIPIDINYAKTHPKSGSATTPAAAGDPTMRIVFDKDTVVGGGQLTGRIYLGDSLHPINDAYGVALSLAYDPSVVDPQSFQFDLGHSDLGTLYDLLALYKHHSSTGQTDISLTRNTTIGKKVTKLIIEFKLVVADDLAGYTQAEMKITKAIVVDSKLHDIAINIQGDSAVISQPTAVKYKDISAFINLYPNPATSKVVVDLGKYTEATISVKDMQGKVIKTLKNTSDKKTINIDIADFATGMYIMDISTKNGHAVKKFSKIN